MRNFWQQIPLVRVVAALITGILLAVFCGSLATSSGLMIVAMVVFCLSFMALVTYSLLGITRQFTWRATAGGALNLLLVSFGYIISWLHVAPNAPGFYGNYVDGASQYTAIISEPTVEKDKTINAVVKLVELQAYGDNLAVCGKLFVNFAKDGKSKQLKYGDVVTFKGNVKPFNPSKNPGEFNYKRYQALHNIYYRIYLNAPAYAIVAHNEGNPLLSQVYRARDIFLGIIRQHVKDENDFGVATALMLGYRDYVNDEITQAYSSSGVLHVLSVSGLHVGIMFLLLNFVLQWLDNRGRKAAIGKAVFIILFMWFYASLTGLSPSVLRSAAMFSLIQVGLVMIRHVNMYNVLAGSAMVLLLSDPFLVMDVGFLLSYFAVVGIVYLQPKIASLWIIAGTVKPKFKKKEKWYLKMLAMLQHDKMWLLRYGIPDFFWQLTAVSIAAQIATLPWSIYYFHQLPNLFIVSNLVVIPLSNLVLILGTSLFVLHWVPYVGVAAGWLFAKLLHAMDQFIFLLDQFPFALWEGLSISLAEVFAFYGLIVLLCWLARERHVKVFILSLAVFGVLLIYNGVEGVQQAAQKQLVVYAIPRQSAIAFIEGQKVLTDFDSALLANKKFMSYYIKPYWYKCGVGEQDTAIATCLDCGKLLEFAGQKVLILDSKFKMPSSHNKLEVDRVIVRHSPYADMEQLQRAFTFKEVIFDSSNKPKALARLKQQCETQKIRYWDVNEQGAYVAVFN